MKKRIRGKIIGGVLGLLTGGGLAGAAVGVIVGHMYDTRRESDYNPWSSFVDFYGGFSGTVEQTNFTVGVIVLGAKMAKADGRVTRAEIEAFRRVFQVKPGQEANVAKLFNRARTNASGFEPYAFQLAHTFKNRPAVLEEILGGLFVIAASDSAGLSVAELRFLKSVAVIFGFDVEDFSRIAARAGVHLSGSGDTSGGTQAPRNESQEAYSILGVKDDMPPEEIKSAYRALIREHHPDRLMAQGVSPEFMATANEKMKRINVAYDIVCKIKGIK